MNLVARLGGDHTEHLRAAVFPFGHHLVPIIRNYRGQNCIHYYRTQLLKSAQQKGTVLSEESRRAIEALDDAVKDDTMRVHIRLEPSDTLFVNNRKKDAWMNEY